jgi:XFP N-terminal domain
MGITGLPLGSLLCDHIFTHLGLRIYQNPNENRSREKRPAGSEQCLFLRGDSRSCLPAEQTPGSINEGGELGYSLAHAYGNALDTRAPPEVYFNRN